MRAAKISLWNGWRKGPGVYMDRIIAMVVAVLVLSAPLSAQEAGSRPVSADSVAKLKSASIQAESAQAAASRAVVRAESAAAASRAHPLAPMSTLTDWAEVAAEIIVLGLLVLLWIGLGRVPARRWLAQRHGAQVLLVWGALVLYTLESCVASVASVFAGHEEPRPALPYLLIAWLAVVIVTWRWASARGEATRAR